MKTTTRGFLLIAMLFSVSFFTNSCSKADAGASLPKEQQVVGEWYIARIELNYISGGIVVKDSILNATPKPKNFVKFDTNGGFEYRHNSTTSNIGTYEFAGGGALITNSLPTSFNWTMITLTSQLFTVFSTETDPAYPGAVVKRYYTFAR